MLHSYEVSVTHELKESFRLIVYTLKDDLTETSIVVVTLS